MRRLLSVAAAVLLAGCGADHTKTPVELSDVPEAALKTVREKMGDATLTHAWRRANGDYEVRGKLKGSGKIREVEVKPDGTFVEME